MITPVENGSTWSVLDAERLADRDARGARVGEAGLAGARVGHAGVHHERADRALGGEVLAADEHRCGAEAVAREDAGHARALVEGDQQQVLAVGLADAGLGDAEAHAGDA